MEMNMDIYTAEITDSIKLIYTISSEKVGRHSHYPHTHSFCELYFLLEGKYSYMVENGIYDVPYGTVIFTRPGELHSVIINEPCVYKRLYYQLPMNALDFLGDRHMRCFSDRPFGHRNLLVLPVDQMNDCVKRILAGVELYNSGSPDARSIMLADLLYTLRTVNSCFDNPHSGTVGERRNTLISDALAYINTHFGEIRSTSEIASALYVSREYLSRSFTREMGIPLTKYLTTKRIEYAKNLLSEGIAPVEASVECGFGDYSHFIQVFRRETGVTPFAYKKGQNEQG